MATQRDTRQAEEPRPLQVGHCDEPEKSLQIQPRKFRFHNYKVRRCRTQSNSQLHCGSDRPQVNVTEPAARRLCQAPAEWPTPGCDDDHWLSHLVPQAV